MAAIRGYLDELGNPKVPLMVRGARGDLMLSALIDTGFDGDLCLPVSVAIELGLDLCGVQRVQLANGSIQNELVFLGEAGFQGGPLQEVEILLTHAEEALLGIGLLKTWKLIIDFPKESVSLHRPAGRRTSDRSPSG